MRESCPRRNKWYQCCLWWTTTPISIRSKQSYWRSWTAHSALWRGGQFENISSKSQHVFAKRDSETKKSKQSSIINLFLIDCSKKQKILLHFLWCIFYCIWCIILIASDVYFCFFYLFFFYLLLWVNAIRSNKTSLRVVSRQNWDFIENFCNSTFL